MAFMDLCIFFYLCWNQNMEIAKLICLGYYYSCLLHRHSWEQNPTALQSSLWRQRQIIKMSLEGKVAFSVEYLMILPPLIWSCWLVRRRCLDRKCYKYNYDIAYRKNVQTKYQQIKQKSNQFICRSWQKKKATVYQLIRTK